MFDRKLLIDVMNKRNVSAYRLFKIANISQSSLSDIINGKATNPTSKTLSKLASALKVPVSRLFKDKYYISNNNDEPINADKEMCILCKELHGEHCFIESDDNHIMFIIDIIEAFFNSNDFDDNTKKAMLDDMSELYWKNKISNNYITDSKDI